MKPRGVTTRDEGGERARGELVLLVEGEEGGLEGGWLRGGEVRFPSCWRWCCGLRAEGVGVGVPGGLTGSRLVGRVGELGAGEGGERMREGEEEEEGKWGG